MRRLLFIMLLLYSVSSIAEETFCPVYKEVGLYGAKQIVKSHPSARKNIPLENRITSLTEFKLELDKAKINKKDVLVLVWAKWSTESLILANGVLRENKLKKYLENINLVSIDSTSIDDTSKKIQRHLKVFGPPALIYFTYEGVEKGRIEYKCIEPVQLLSWLSEK